MTPLDASCTAYASGFGSVYRAPLTTGTAVPGPKELRPRLMGLPRGSRGSPTCAWVYLEAQTCRWRGHKE